MKPCNRCFRVVGEYHRCAWHGGEPAFTAGVSRWKSKPPDFPPPEAIGNLWHPWWNFLDKGEKVLAEALP